MELAQAFEDGCTGFVLGGAVIYNLIAYLLEKTADAEESGTYGPGHLIEDQVWPLTLQCNAFVKKLYGLYTPGLNAFEMGDFWEFCDEYRPNFLVIDMLGEELSNMTSEGSLDDICDHVMSIACAAVHKYDAQAVIVVAPIARAADILTTYEEYEQNIVYIKNRMMELVLEGDKVYFWDLPSFMEEETMSPLPIDQFSADLKVPGPEFESDGFKMYLGDVKQMLNAAGWITCMALQYVADLHMIDV